MNKQDLLRSIAEAGYNVGYAAKKHFATFDVASKAPGLISTSSAAVGVFGLVIEYPSKKHLSAAFLVLGLIAMRISMWDHKKEDYNEAGIKITNQYNKLKKLYYDVKGSEQLDLTNFEQQLEAIQTEFNQSGKSGQMMFSDWYAHYKFFWQQQIGWIEEQKKFSLFRDRIPLSFTASSALVLLLLIGWIVSSLVS